MRTDSSTSIPDGRARNVLLSMWKAWRLPSSVRNNRFQNKAQVFWLGFFFFLFVSLVHWLFWFGFQNGQQCVSRENHIFFSIQITYFPGFYQIILCKTDFHLDRSQIQTPMESDNTCSHKHWHVGVSRPGCLGFWKQHLEKLRCTCCEGEAFLLEA